MRPGLEVIIKHLGLWQTGTVSMVEGDRVLVRVSKKVLVWFAEYDVFRKRAEEERSSDVKKKRSAEPTY